MAFSALPGRFASFEVQKDTLWLVVPGIGDVSLSDTGSTPTEISAFEGVKQITGIRSIGTVALNVVGWIPQHAASLRLKALADSGAPGNFRLKTKEEVLLPTTGTGVTIEVAKDTGTATLADAPDFVFEPGQVLTAGSTDLVVLTVDANNKVASLVNTDGTVVGTAISATTYSVKVPSLQLQFSAVVSDYGSFTLASDNVLTSTINLTPRSRVPGWSVA